MSEVKPMSTKSRIVSTSQTAFMGTNQQVVTKILLRNAFARTTRAVVTLHGQQHVLNITFPIVTGILTLNNTLLVYSHIRIQCATTVTYRTVCAT